MNKASANFAHIPHPRTAARLNGTAPPPPKVADERAGVNGRLGLFITSVVGTMWAAYAFTLLAFISFPSAIGTGNSIIIVAWVAQTFLQLVLLPIIIVGQNILGRTADKRADQTYTDAEAILHECVQIQAHLAAQDEAQAKQIADLRQLLNDLGVRSPNGLSTVSSAAESC